MGETGIDLVAIAPGSHMDWLLGFHPHPDERPCLLLIGPEKETFLMPALNAEGTREDTDISFHPWSDDEGPEGALMAALADVGATGAKKVVLDETMRADFALLVLDNLPGAGHAFTTETLGALRMVKDQSEYEALKMNAGIADRAMLKAFAAIAVGKTEREIADVAKAHFAFRRRVAFLLDRRRRPERRLPAPPERRAQAAGRRRRRHRHRRQEGELSERHHAHGGGRPSAGRL
jgi:Xaa-Pro aminopeptidase